MNGPRPHHDHDSRQFSSDVLYHIPNPLGAVRGERIKHGSPQTNEIRTHGQAFEHVASPAESTLHQHGNFPLDGLGDASHDLKWVREIINGMGPMV